MSFDVFTITVLHTSYSMQTMYWMSQNKVCLSCGGFIFVDSLLSAILQAFNADVVDEDRHFFCCCCILVCCVYCSWQLARL